MFQIRSEQIKAVASAQVDQANNKLVIYGRKRFPSEFGNADTGAMLRFVRGVRATAAQFGIEKENDVATFFDFTVMYGEGFPHAPWANDVLSSGALHGPDKMAVLRYRVRETGVNL